MTPFLSYRKTDSFCEFSDGGLINEGGSPTSKTGRAISPSTARRAQSNTRCQNRSQNTCRGVPSSDAEAAAIICLHASQVTSGVSQVPPPPQIVNSVTKQSLPRSFMRSCTAPVNFSTAFKSTSVSLPPSRPSSRPASPTMSRSSGAMVDAVMSELPLMAVYQFDEGKALSSSLREAVSPQRRSGEWKGIGGRSASISIPRSVFTSRDSVNGSMNVLTIKKDRPQSHSVSPQISGVYADMRNTPARKKCVPLSASDRPITSGTRHGGISGGSGSGLGVRRSRTARSAGSSKRDWT
jgi:hypothetical protein